MENFNSFESKINKEVPNKENEKLEEEKLLVLMNSLLDDMKKRGGGYDDLYIVFQAKKYNVAPKFVEYIYREIINSETIKDKNFMGSYIAHNPNLDKEPHRWAKYYGGRG
jgi:hypothetical protein